MWVPPCALTGRSDAILASGLEYESNGYSPDTFSFDSRYGISKTNEVGCRKTLFCFRLNELDKQRPGSQKSQIVSQLNGKGAIRF